MHITEIVPIDLPDFTEDIITQGVGYYAETLGLPPPEPLSGRFYTVTELTQHLQSTKQTLKLNEELLKLDRCRFMVIDNIGYANRGQQESSVLFELIAHRHEQASIITANQAFSEWHNIFSDKNMTVASVDWLIHHGNIIELEGESYRKKNSST